MTVEVRQLIVKSNVLQRHEADGLDGAQLHEETRKAILEECRRLILDTLQEMKER